MGLKSLNIGQSYTGRGEAILHNFLLPTICESIYYDRISSFFNVDSLLSISQGIENIYSKRGKIRLLIGIHSIPGELVTAITSAEALQEEINTIRIEIQKELALLSDYLEKKRIATLSWMIQDGLLEVKAIAVKGNGIFHPKTLIFTDENGDKIAAVGSPNETSSGLGGNYEQLMVAKSWNAPEAVLDQVRFFEDLWYGKIDGLISINIEEELAYTIEKGLGNSFIDNQFNKHHDDVIKLASKMPANFFVSGDIPALYVHQERAVLDALSRWPVRVLFADEVGLGKTFEVASTMVFLIKYCNVKRVLILTPKSILQQWQDELYEHFKLEAYLFDSSQKKYIDPNGRIINIGDSNPLGKTSPNIILMSAQYIRGKHNTNNIFDADDTIIPDLLILDEAHSARNSRDFSGNSVKTILYEMLEKISKTIPHIILATATPMQKEANEYHAILKLLGLPSKWKSVRNYQTSLKLISSNRITDISDAYTAASLLISTIDNMKPDLGRLESDELNLLQDLINKFEVLDKADCGYFIQENWEKFRTLFIKLHPAHLLTVRNTRRALEKIHYHFPKRNLFEIQIKESSSIKRFYQEIDNYLRYDCFKVESCIYKEKKINIGFLKSNFYQRLASSLFSCRESLSRRLSKIYSIEEKILNVNPHNNLIYDGFEEEVDETLADDDVIEINDFNFIDMDLNRDKINKAIKNEKSRLSELINAVNDLLLNYGDQKIITSITKAIEFSELGDAVLLFSRYTDTIEALKNEYRKQRKNTKPYAIYTGNKAVIIDENDFENKCDKNDIKKRLSDGTIKLVFCSDAASEGLNLQAAKTLINVDVPWTPSRLEQRIGRIARLGQTADDVNIYNVWYPHSIEARMYGRIQARLNETNLAVGEFPDVIANVIRKEIIDDTGKDDQLIDEFNQIRHSYQVKALDELWRSGPAEITESHFIRQNLMNICKMNFKRAIPLSNDEIIQFLMPDNTFVELTDVEGKPESISLGSIPWKYKNFVLSEWQVIKDNKGNYSAFVLKNDLSKIIDIIAVLKALQGKNISRKDFLTGYPKMLPKPYALNLKYAIDTEIGPPPSFWNK